MKAQVKVIHPNAKLPMQATDGSAGYDVCSVEQVILAPGQRALVKTGLKIAVPYGYHIEVRPRSGLAHKRGLTVLNTPGTIDADYRGECCVILINLSQDAQQLDAGERIAQFVFMKHEQVEIEDVDELSETIRGEGGIGSTGTK